MTPEEELCDAIRRLRPNLDFATVEIQYRESRSGIMAQGRLRSDQSRIARVYLDKASGTTYVVPSAIGDIDTMNEAVADPEWRARLTVI